MTNLQKQFFSLVQAGLWGSPADENLFDNQTNWQEIYQLARIQTLLAIVFDGIQTLPPDKRPDHGLYLKWCNVVIQIEDYNRILNRELINIYTLYRAHRIDPILLKGQGIAQNYRNPLHRHCGDIDLYIGHKNFDLANELIRKEATDEHEENYKHTSLKWHGVSIENHRIITELSSPAGNRNFQDEIEQWYNKSSHQKITIDGYPINVPPRNFDAVYILTHSVLHFMNEGIGLRQVCDWACLLHHQRDNIDWVKVKDLLQRMNLTTAARTFGIIAVKYLGLPDEDFPFEFTLNDIKNGKWLMSKIMTGGNFGRYDSTRTMRPQGYWRGKWHTFTRACSRCRDYASLAPAEARWYPLKLIYHSTGIQFKFLRRKLAGS